MYWFFLYFVLRFGPLSLIYVPCVSCTELSPSVADDQTLEKFEKFPVHTFNTHNEYMMYATKPMHSSPTIDNQQSTSRNKKSTATFVRETIHMREKRSRTKCKGSQRQCVLNVGGDKPKLWSKSKHSFKEEDGYETDAEPYSSGENGIDYTNTITGTARRKGLIKQQRALRAPSNLQHKRRKKAEVYAKRYEHPVDSVGHKKHILSHHLHLPHDRLDDSRGSKKHLLSGNFFHIDKNSLKTHVISEDDDTPQESSKEVARNSTKDAEKTKSNSTKESFEGKNDNKTSFEPSQEKSPSTSKLSPKDKEKFINDISAMWEKGKSNISSTVINSTSTSLKANESSTIQSNGSTPSSKEKLALTPKAENMTKKITKDEEKQRGKTIKPNPSGVDDVIEYFNPENTTGDSNHTKISKEVAKNKASTVESDEKLHMKSGSLSDTMDDGKAKLSESNPGNKTNLEGDTVEGNCKRMDCQNRMKKIRKDDSTELYKTKKATADGEKHEVLDSPPEKLPTAKEVNLQPNDDNFLSTDQFYKLPNHGSSKSQTFSQGKQKAKNTSSILKNDDAQFTTGVQANYSRFLGITEETAPIHLNSSTDISFTRDAQANHTRFIGVRFEPARLLNSSTTGTKRNQSKVTKDNNALSVGLHRKDATMNTAYDMNTGMDSTPLASTALQNPSPQIDNSLLPSVHNGNAAAYDTNGGGNNLQQQNTNTIQQDTSTQNDNSAVGTNSAAANPLFMVITPPDMTNATTAESSAQNTNAKQDAAPAAAPPEEDKQHSNDNKENSNSKSKPKESPDANHFPAHASSGNTSKSTENTNTATETLSTDAGVTPLPHDTAKTSNKAGAASADYNATNEQNSEDTNALQHTSNKNKAKEPSLTGELQDNTGAATPASQSTGDGSDVNGDGLGTHGAKKPKKESDDTFAAAAPPETHHHNNADNNVAPPTPTPTATQPPSTTAVASSQQTGYESPAESTAAPVSDTAATTHKGASGKQTATSAGAVGYDTSTSTDASHSQQQTSTENTAPPTATAHKGTNWKQTAAADTSAEYVASAHETTTPPERVKPSKPAQQVASSTEATQTTHKEAETPAQHVASSTQATQTTHKGVQAPAQHVVSSPEPPQTTHKGGKSNKQNAGSTDAEYVVEEPAVDTETEYVEEVPEKGKSSKQHGATTEVATEEYVTPVVEETPQKEKSGKHAPPTAAVATEEYVTPVAETSNKGKSDKQTHETTQVSTEYVTPVVETSHEEPSTEYVAETAETAEKGKSGKHTSSSTDYIAVEEEPHEEVYVPVNEKAHKGKSSSKYAASPSDENQQSSQNANTTKPAAAASETAGQESSTEYISPVGENQHKASSAKYDAASSETSQQSSADHTATTSDSSQNTNASSTSTPEKVKSTKTQSGSTDASQTTAPTDYAASAAETPQKNKSTKHATSDAQIPNGESSTDHTTSTTDTQQKEKPEKGTGGEYSEQSSPNNLDSFNAHLVFSPGKNQGKSSSGEEKAGMQSEASNAYLVLSPTGSGNETKDNGNVAQSAPYNGTIQPNALNVAGAQNVSSTSSPAGTTASVDYYQGHQEHQDVRDSHGSQETGADGQFSSFHPHEKHSAPTHKKTGEISNEAESVNNTGQTSRTPEMNDKTLKTDLKVSPIEESKEGKQIKQSTKKLTDNNEDAPTQNKGSREMKSSRKMKDETSPRFGSKKKTSSSSYSQEDNKNNERGADADLSQNQNARDSSVEKIADRNTAEDTDTESKNPARLRGTKTKKYDDGEEDDKNNEKSRFGESTSDEKDESAKIHPIGAQKMSSSFHGKVSVKEKENFEKAEKQAEKQQSHSGFHPLSTSLSGSNHHDELATKMASKDQENVNSVDSREIGKENNLENTEDAVNTTINLQSTAEVKNEKTTDDNEAKSQEAGDSKKVSTRLRAKKPLHVKESVDTVISGKESDGKDVKPIEGKKEKSGKSRAKGAKEKTQMSKETKTELKPADKQSFVALQGSEKNDDITNTKENEEPSGGSDISEKKGPQSDTLLKKEEDRNRTSMNSENSKTEVDRTSSKEVKEQADQNISNEKLSKSAKADLNVQKEKYYMKVSNKTSHSNNQSSPEKALTEPDNAANTESFMIDKINKSLNKQKEAEMIKDEAKIAAEVKNTSASEQQVELDTRNNTMENMPADKNDTMSKKEKEAAEQRAVEQTAVELKAVKERAQSEDEEYPDKAYVSSRKDNESTDYKEKNKVVAHSKNKSQKKEEGTIDNEGKDEKISYNKHRGKGAGDQQNTEPDIKGESNEVKNTASFSESPKVIVSLQTEIPKDTKLIDSKGRLSSISGNKDEDRDTAMNDNAEKAAASSFGRKNTENLSSKKKEKDKSGDWLETKDLRKDKKDNDGTVFDEVATERLKSDNEVVSKKLSSKLISQKESGAKDNIKENKDKEEKEGKLESGAKGNIKEIKDKEEKEGKLESGLKGNIKETDNKEEKAENLESGAKDNIKEIKDKEEKEGKLESGAKGNMKETDNKEEKAENLESGAKDNIKEIKNKEEKEGKLESGLKGNIKDTENKEEKAAKLGSGAKDNIKETKNKEEKEGRLESSAKGSIKETENKEEKTANLESGAKNSITETKNEEEKTANFESDAKDSTKEIKNKAVNGANLKSGAKDNIKEVEKDERNVTSLLMNRNLTRENDDETEVSMFTHSGQSTIPHSTRSSADSDDDDTPDLSEKDSNDDRAFSKRKQHDKKHDCTIHFVNEKWKKWAKCRHTFKDEDYNSNELDQQSTGGVGDSGGDEIEFTDTSKEPVDLNVYVHTAARSKTLKYRRRSNRRWARYYGGKRKFYLHEKKESIANFANRAQKYGRKRFNALYGKRYASPRFTHRSVFHANRKKLKESTGSKKHLLSGSMQANKQILKTHVVLDDFPEEDLANFERLFPGSKGYVKLKSKLARLCRRSKDPKCQLHSRKFLSKALSKLSKEEDEKEESRNRTVAAVKELEDVHKGFKHAHRELNNSTLSAIDELEKILSTKHKLKHNFHRLLRKELLTKRAHSVDDDDDDDKDNGHTAKMRSILARLDRKKKKLLRSFHTLLHKSLMFFKQFDHSSGRRHHNYPDDLKFEDPSGRSSVSRQTPLHDGDEDDDDSINTRFMREGDGSIDKLASARHRLHTLSDDDDDDVDNIKVSNFLSHLHNRVQLNSFDDNDDEDNNVALKTGKKNTLKTKEKVHALTDDDDDNEFLVKTNNYHNGLRQVVGFHDDDDVLDDDDDRDNSAGHKLDKMRHTLVSKSQSSVDEKKEWKNDESKSTEKGQSRHAVVSHSKLESGGWTSIKEISSESKNKKSPRRRRKKKLRATNGKGDSSSALALFDGADDEPEDDTDSSGDDANVKTVSRDFNAHLNSLKAKSKTTISSMNSERPSATLDFNERFNSIIKSKEVKNDGKETASAQSPANVDSIPVKPSMVLNALLLTPPETGKVLADNLEETKTTNANQSIEESKGPGAVHAEEDKKTPTMSQSSESTAAKSSPATPLKSVQSITGSPTISPSKNDDSSVLKAALDAYLNAKLADEAKASAISKIKASAAETVPNVANETSAINSKIAKNNNDDTDKNILKDLHERGQPNNFYSVDDSGHVAPLEYQSPSAAAAIPSAQESYTWPPRGSSATMQVLDSITHLAGLLEHITKTQSGSHLRSCAFCSPMVNLCKDMTHLLSEFMKILGGFLRFVHTFGTPKVRDNATYNHLYNNFDHFYNVYANLC